MKEMPNGYILSRLPSPWCRCDLFSTAVVSVLLAAAVAPAYGQSYEAQIDYDELFGLLGGAVPDGTGVVVSQVEATSGDAYMPNVAHSEFAGKTITDGTGSSSAVSSHSHNMARHFYGNSTSVAPGITDVTMYEGDDYLANLLNVDSGGNGDAPLAQLFKVQNHSWIGEYEDDGGNSLTALNVQALRRFDYTIDTYDMTAVIGLNNGSSNPQPILWAHSYNAIAVGRTDGDHSSGTTTIASYGPNRTRPDVVAPQSTTSAATAITSSVAGLLHESGAATDAVRSESMKAIILAGATKDEFPGWTHSTTQPLDATYGAGEVNVLNSYLIQAGGTFDGHATAPPTVGSYGWDYGIVTAGTDLLYDFEIPAGTSANELSIALTWNVEVTDSNSGAPFSPVHSLANLDLQLTNSSSTVVAESLSTIDNVEHIYLTNLAADTYTLRLSSDTTRDFGLAWRLTMVPEPSTAWLMLLAAAAFAGRRRSFPHSTSSRQ